MHRSNGEMQFNGEDIAAEGSVGMTHVKLKLVFQLHVPRFATIMQKSHRL